MTNTNKKKRQTDDLRVTPEVKPNLETQSVQHGGGQSKSAQKGNKARMKKAEGNSTEYTKDASYSLPLVCGRCQKEYKNIRSNRTHMYQVHQKTVPEGSSHSLKGKPFTRAAPCKANHSTKIDNLKQPRQDKVLSSGSSQKISETIEEEPYEQPVQSRKAEYIALKGGGPQIDSPKGRKTGK